MVQALSPYSQLGIRVDPQRVEAQAMLQKAAETTPGFRLVGDAAISADDLGWSCALIDGVLEFETPTLDECAWLSQRLAEAAPVDAVELFASTALGYWGEFREAATPYADDHWDFDVGALRRDGYAILRGAAPEWRARPARQRWRGQPDGPGPRPAHGPRPLGRRLRGAGLRGRRRGAQVRRGVPQRPLRRRPGFLCRGPAPPAAPATADAPLTVTRHVQLATYRPEVDGSGGYTLHSDNGPSSPGKAKKNGRHVTAILYLNEHWDEADGGALELYPDSVDDAAVQRVLLGQAGAWAPADERNLEAALAGHRRVEVWPEAGTVVVFDSRLVHTVRPAKRDRQALHALDVQARGRRHASPWAAARCYNDAGRWIGDDE
ncbi:hypothetical protein SO694_000011068 [Aureococcus anophagefferens]|uniref:Fe2OG dioxygenase domain-containing protein n=1 Tax=Aureococcus anophagefferens TaxID=44056 RepID=A0ABR1GC89_AURAN